MTINYWEQILENRKKRDYIKWILCDKYIAKQFAETIGFKIPKTYQLTDKPTNIKFNIKQYVVKPTDLCDGCGVYLMNNNVNMIDNKHTKPPTIIKKYNEIRSSIKHEYYMHELMYDFKVPFKGYIVEELLLDENNDIPSDYKCYAFNGRVFLIAKTYNRHSVKDNNNQQTQVFHSVWMTRNWKPIPVPMIKENYKYQKLPKPRGYDKMIHLVENASRILQRHCRIDVYLINGEVYFGEFTFFGGAFLHTRLANNILGLKWNKNQDNIDINDKNNKKLIKQLNALQPPFYTKIDVID